MMSFLRVFSACFIFVVILIPAPVSAADPSKELAKKAHQVLQKNCYSCHGAEGSDEGGLNYVLNLKRLVATKKILPKQAHKSPLFARIIKGEMPPEGESLRPEQADIEILRRWISSGAPALPNDEHRTPVSNEEMVKSIQRDLESASPRDRRFLRYFTITHLYNAQLSEGEIATFRLALGKMLNSLSWEKELVKPKPINPQKTLYRIDLRSLRWSISTWDSLLDVYPYHLTFRTHAFSECAKMSQSALPLIRVDWFIAAASQPPLYHQILEMPDSLSGLESQLRIKFEQNISQDRAIRAGFSESGISEYPRIIERHKTSDGSCWVSHDFSGSTGQRNFFSHPLDFKADGGEIIFSLPNGLQAYMLVDVNGNLISKAPTSIVKDPQQIDAAVVNGISCIRCHAQGIIPKVDEVRRIVNANKKAYESQISEILALYMEPTGFQEKVDEDRQRFQSALKQLGITRYSVRSEPIFNTMRRYDESLDLELASSEFGLSSEGLSKAIKRNLLLQRSLGVLSVSGGTIKRRVYEATFSSHAHLLGIGKTSKPEQSWREYSLSESVTDEFPKFRQKAFSKLGGKSRFPSYLSSANQPFSSKEGLKMNGRNYVRTKDGKYLKKDFKFEIVFEMKKGDSKNIAFIGIGEGRPGRPYDEPINSVNLRIHPPNLGNGEVGLANHGDGQKIIGHVREEGTHRVIIEKTGDVVRFEVDIDNDGETDDDIQTTIPDIKTFTTFFHEKNMYIFFGGGGVYKEVRIQTILNN